MNIITISGIISVLLGIILGFIAVRQCRSRIGNEENFISAEAEIIRMDSRKSIVLINWIPIIAKEYRPVICYRTENGESITSAQMPFSLKASAECAELYRMYECRTPITIRYNPHKPSEYCYNSKKAFHIRETVYKFVVSAILIGGGVCLIRGGMIF